MLSLTTKGRYAARIMAYLAQHPGPAPTTKQSIAQNEDISADYIEQILTRLKVAQLVRSHRGRGGGFSLSRSPSTITLWEVLKAVEGPVSVAPCLHGTCKREEDCPTRPVWESLTETINTELQGITIAQLAGDAEPATAPR